MSLDVLITNCMCSVWPVAQWNTAHQCDHAANWSLMPGEGGGRNTCQQNVNVVPHYHCAGGHGTWNKPSPCIVTALWLRHHVADHKGGGWWGAGVELWEWSGGHHRCAQGSCPSTIYFCLFHHCAHLIHVKQLFDGERGKEEEECQGELSRNARGKRWNRRIVFMNLYLFAGDWLPPTPPFLSLFLLNILVCIYVCPHLHLNAAQSLLWPLCAAPWTLSGLSGLHRAEAHLLH